MMRTRRHGQEGVPSMEVDMYTNAQLIRKLREDRAWSQEHLAAVAGLSARTIQRVEAESSASRETRMAIAVALDIELAQLNQVTGTSPAAAPAMPSTAAPAPPARSDIGWRITIVALVLVAFLYTLGKDAALKDGRAACAAKQQTNCAAP